MIIDSHVHLFSSRIIANVSAKSGLVAKLDLRTVWAARRTNIASLLSDCRPTGIDRCLMLPTAEAHDVEKVNRTSIALSKEWEFLSTAGTLHPSMRDIRNELSYLQASGVRAIKLCSFSQGFFLAAPETFHLFRLIEEANANGKGMFFVILDTFYRAHDYFGTPTLHTTTPLLFGKIVKSFPTINFVAAHMGGLAAPFEEIITHLPPSNNLYLDTSNAAHTLSEKEFLRLLAVHGPEHILFGTDWPWFGQEDEIGLVNRLIAKAGFSRAEQEQIFYRNCAHLLGIAPR